MNVVDRLNVIARRISRNECPGCGKAAQQQHNHGCVIGTGRVTAVHASRHVEYVDARAYRGAVTLLHRWLTEASAMGGGPRAQLTQDTLDAVGMPSDD